MGKYLTEFSSNTAYNASLARLDYPNVSLVANELKYAESLPTMYRWVDNGDTMCGDGEEDDSCTLFVKEQKQQSTDGGAHWTNVSPAEYRKGDMIEEDSPECGCGDDCETEWYGADDYENEGMGGMDSYRVLGMKIEGDASIDPNEGWSHYVIFSTEADEKIKVVAQACCAAGCECDEGNDDPECDGQEEGYCPSNCWKIHYLIYTYEYDEMEDDYRWSDNPVGQVDTCSFEENYVGLNNYLDFEWYYIDTNDISPYLEDPNNLQLYVTNCPN